MNQKEAIIGIIKSVLGDKYSPNIPVRNVIKEYHIDAIAKIVIKGIRDFAIPHSNPFMTDKELRTYTISTIHSLMRKTPELNGGEKYVPQVTGSGNRLDSDTEFYKSLREAESLDVDGFISDLISKK